MVSRVGPSLRRTVGERVGMVLVWSRELVRLLSTPLDGQSKRVGMSRGLVLMLIVERSPWSLENMDWVLCSEFVPPQPSSPSDCSRRDGPLSSPLDGQSKRWSSLVSSRRTVEEVGRRKFGEVISPLSSSSRPSKEVGRRKFDEVMCPLSSSSRPSEEVGRRKFGELIERVDTPLDVEGRSVGGWSEKVWRAH